MHVVIRTKLSVVTDIDILQIVTTIVIDFHVPEDKIFGIRPPIAVGCLLYFQPHYSLRIFVIIVDTKNIPVRGKFIFTVSKGYSRRMSLQCIGIGIINIYSKIAGPYTVFCGNPRPIFIVITVRPRLQKVA